MPVYYYRSVLLLLVLFTMAGCSHKPMIIAHRGASGYAPENTLASVRHAWAVRADAVEVDVHLSADERVMVIHDKDTQRVADGNLTVRTTDSEALRRLDVGRHRSSRFAGEQIPYLEEVIATIPDGKKLFIEIKCEADVIPYIKQIIENSSPGRDLIIISFNLDLLARAKQEIANVPMYWLVSAKQDELSKQFLPYDSSLIDTVRKKGLDGLDVHHGGLTAEYVDMVHAAGLDAYVWTVNDLETAAKMVEMGVDGITTDFPADLMMFLK